MPAANPRALEDAQAFMRRVAGTEIGRYPHCKTRHWPVIEHRLADRAALAANMQATCRGRPLPKQTGYAGPRSPRAPTAAVEPFPMTIGTHAATIPAMKPFRWPPDKNGLLKAERGISFEEITVAVEAGALLEVVPHPNPKKYPRQKVMVVKVAGYAYLVPFVEEDDHFFLKTIIPSRKATRDLIAKESDDV